MITFKEFEYEKTRPYGNLRKLIKDFRDSGFKCAILENWEYANALVGARSINTACKRYKTEYVRAIVRKEQIYLVNDLVK